MRIIEHIIIILMIGLIIAILDLTRRKYLKERYSLVWLSACIIILIFTIWQGILLYLSNLLGFGGFTTGPIIVIGAILLLIVNLHFSVRLSKQDEQIENMAEEIAILKYEHKKEQ